MILSLSSKELIQLYDGAGALDFGRVPGDGLAELRAALDRAEQSASVRHVSLAAAEGGLLLSAKSVKQQCVLTFSIVA